MSFRWLAPPGGIPHSRARSQGSRQGHDRRQQVINVHGVPSGDAVRAQCPRSSTRSIRVQPPHSRWLTRMTRDFLEEQPPTDWRFRRSRIGVGPRGRSAGQYDSGTPRCRSASTCRSSWSIFGALFCVPRARAPTSAGCRTAIAGRRLRRHHSGAHHLHGTDATIPIDEHDGRSDLDAVAPR